MNLNIEVISEFRQVSLKETNKYLEKWSHKMGPLKRGNQGAICHMLFFKGEPIAVTTASHLIRCNVGGGLEKLTRANTIELSRLCSSREGICRIALRMWREFVFPDLKFPIAISYQDSNLHSGNIYRFDGWKRIGYSHSGTDSRSGRIGRNKYIWVWPQNYQELLNNIASPEKNIVSIKNQLLTVK